MARPTKSAREAAEEQYVRWAKAFLVCRDERMAAFGVGVRSEYLDAFLAQVKFCEAANRILAEDLTSMPNFKDPEQVREAVLFQLWREAKSGGATQAAARVSALKAISEISGLEDPSDAAKANTQGGMLLVPVMDMASWEKACIKAQQALRAANHD